MVSSAIFFVLGLGHQGGEASSTYQNQGAARCPRGHRGKYRGKEDGDNKAQTRHNSRQARPSALSDASTALDKGRHGRRAQESTNGDKAGVGTVRKRRAGKVFGLGVNHTAEANHGVESGRGVDNVDVEECEEGEGKPGGTGTAKGPVKAIEGFGHGLPGDNLLEEFEARVTLVGVGKVGDSGVAPETG